MKILLLILSTTLVCGYHSFIHRLEFKLRRSQHLFSTSTFSSVSKTGSHGSKFRYLPIICGAPDEHFPRILSIAGVYPVLDIAKFKGAPKAPEANPGYWAYDFQEHGEHKWGKVAVPGSEILTTAIDPVVVISTNKDLGVASSEKVEVVVVVDRGNVHFRPDKFYLCEDSRGGQVIQWMETLTPDVSILGKIILCVMPLTSNMRQASGGFSENGDE